MCSYVIVLLSRRSWEIDQFSLVRGGADLILRLECNEVRIRCIGTWGSQVEGDIKRCHFSFPVFLKKPVSTHIFWNIYRYTAYIILFGFSSSSWSLLYRFWWITRDRSRERGRNVRTYKKTCSSGIATLHLSQKLWLYSVYYTFWIPLI